MSVNRIKMIYKIKEFIKWYCNPYFWLKPYWVSFVEEGIFNPDYEDYIAGRVEIWTHWSEFDIDEWRFLTKDLKGFYKMRDNYDCKSFSFWGLRKFKKMVENYHGYFSLVKIFK